MRHLVGAKWARLYGCLGLLLSVWGVHGVMISEDNRLFLDILRGGSIFRVVLAHLGLSWIYQPYSGYVLVFLPLLFFVSGAVSYGSFKRKSNTANYILNRIVTLAVPYYLLLIVSFFCLFVYERGIARFDYYLIFQYLSFNAANFSDSWPVPLGQVWFIHSLFFIVILSVFIFHLSKISPLFLVAGLLSSLALGLAQSFYSVGESFWILKHNLYQPLSNLGFFTFGAYYYIHKERFTNKLNRSVFFALFVVTSLFSFFFVDNYRIDAHFYYPDLFFMLCCYTAIFLVLSLEAEILYLVKRVSILGKFLLFMNRNAYSVFLIHGYIVYVLAIKFGLMDLGGDPSRALLKVLGTIIITAIFAVPFTYMCKNITVYLKSRYLCKTTVRQVIE
jgi:hypothetical protein